MPETHVLDPPQQADATVAFIGPHLGQSRSQLPLVGAVARVYWILAGNAALYLLALDIALRGPEYRWTTDVAFWTVVASLALVRYVDIAALGGATASGGAASLRDWHRYVRRLLPIAAIVWLIAHGLALIDL
jgi:hypothetical protein